MSTEINPDTPAVSARPGLARPPAGAALLWLKEGWRLFRLAPLAWTGMAAFIFLLMLLAGNYLHRSVVEVLSPFVVAGFMVAADAARRGELVHFLLLGEGFRRALAGLAGVGVLYLAGTLVIEFAVRQMSGGGLDDIVRLAQQDPAGIDPVAARQLLDQALPALFTAIVLLIPLLLATWFAPALVLFHGFGAVNSLWWSLWACGSNWRPLGAFGVLIVPLGALAGLIPFGLGLLVFMPVLMLATYAAYRDIFVVTAPPAA
jgi:hypothetical protein